MRGVKEEVLLPERLEEIGRSMFGERWHTPMRTLLGIDHDTLRRWLFGVCAVPPCYAGMIARCTVGNRPLLRPEHALVLEWILYHQGSRCSLDAIARGVGISKSDTDLVLSELLRVGALLLRGDAGGMQFKLRRRA